VKAAVDARLPDAALAQQHGLAAVPKGRADDRPFLERDLGLHMHGDPGYHAAVPTGALPQLPQRSRGSSRFGLVLALACAQGCAHLGRGQGPQGWHYTVAPSAALDRLDVEVCFRDRIPATLVADEDGAADYLLSATAGGRPLKIDRASGEITAGDVRGKCVRYAVDLARMADEVVEGVRVGGVMTSSPHLWLWRPQKLVQESEVSLSFDLPADMGASVPWPRLAADGRRPRYHLSSTAFRWASQVVLGDFHALRFTAAGCEFEVAVMDLPREISDEGLQRWLGVAATTVARLYDGRFPVPHVQVIVVPYPGGGDPVYFGMALRGGGPAVQLLVSSEAEDARFPGEWVAIHEFLHHGMPFVQHEDAWLSEGFVTYYTEVLSARAGFQDERAAWGALLAGFGRGARAGTGQSLAQESRDMHENHAYQRVYWGGAAIALIADVALREAGSSLDAAMRHIQRCCRDTQRVWPAQQVLRAMDDSGPATAAARPRLEALSGPILRSAGFPRLSAIYRKLGVVVVDGDPKLDESASLAKIRRAIFTQPAP
jgi:hypothetical protein